MIKFKDILKESITSNIENAVKSIYDEYGNNDRGYVGGPEEGELTSKEYGDPEKVRSVIFDAKNQVTIWKNAIKRVESLIDKLEKELSLQDKGK